MLGKRGVEATRATKGTPFVVETLALTLTLPF